MPFWSGNQRGRDQTRTAKRHISLCPIPTSTLSIQPSTTAGRDSALDWITREVTHQQRSDLGCYAVSDPTLQCVPSESTNCASTPPKSCFLGGMVNRTPLALM